MPRPLIYTPSGRAGEYSDKGYAANLYSGCSHGCKYCYAPLALRRDRQMFCEVKPAPDVLERLEYDLFVRHKDKPLEEPLFLCFSCDPYCPEEAKHYITTKAINLIHRHGSRVRMLTKNGSLAQRDIPALKPGDEFGVSLTCHHLMDSLFWEPAASAPFDRIRALRVAKYGFGITTWASLEPVIYPDQTLRLIEETADFVDIYKVGMMNHTGSIDQQWRKRLPDVNWSNFGAAVVRLLISKGKTFYIKQDLREHLPDYELALLKNGWWRP